MDNLHIALVDDADETCLSAAELRQLLIDSIDEEMNDGANDD
jgi:hypothetical protein